MFTQEEADLIKVIIIEGGDIWSNPRLNPIKQKIKTHFRNVLDEQCCYCRRSTLGEFNLVLDIEHILPKKHFRSFMFTPKNLSVSCKRCNMDIKKQDTSFIRNLSLIDTEPFNRDNYLFIHPNLDLYFQNMDYFVEIVNDNRLIKYNPLTDKGTYTYSYFKLEALETNSVDRAQGISDVELNEDIDSGLIIEIQDLLRI